MLCKINELINDRIKRIWDLLQSRPFLLEICLVHSHFSKKAYSDKKKKEEMEGRKEEETKKTYLLVF